MSKPSRPPAALSGIATAMLHAGVVLLVVTTSLVVGQVVCRNFFDLGLPWADELARYCGMALVFLAIPRLLLDDKHIAMDLVPKMLPRAGQTLLDIVTRLLSLAFCAIMLWALCTFVTKAWRISTPALGMPNPVYYLPAILGLAGFAAVTLYRLRRPAPPATTMPQEPDA